MQALRARTIQVRAHTGTLEASLQTLATIEATRRALHEYLCHYYPQLQRLDPWTLEIEPYIYDTRINWMTYVVKHPDHGILAFTDGPLGIHAEPSRR